MLRAPWLRSASLAIIALWNRGASSDFSALLVWIASLPLAMTVGVHVPHPVPF
jgi:hypothetical protein